MRDKRPISELRTPPVCGPAYATRGLELIILSGLCRCRLPQLVLLTLAPTLDAAMHAVMREPELRVSDARHHPGNRSVADGGAYVVLGTSADSAILLTVDHMRLAASCHTSQKANAWREWPPTWGRPASLVLMSLNGPRGRFSRRAEEEPTLNKSQNGHIFLQRRACALRGRGPAWFVPRLKALKDLSWHCDAAAPARMQF